MYNIIVFSKIKSNLHNLLTYIKNCGKLTTLLLIKEIRETTLSLIILCTLWSSRFCLTEAFYRKIYAALAGSCHISCTRAKPLTNSSFLYVRVYYGAAVHNTWKKCVTSEVYICRHFQDTNGTSVLYVLHVFVEFLKLRA